VKQAQHHGLLARREADWLHHRLRVWEWVYYWHSRLVVQKKERTATGEQEK
jgi:hypothetical protein